MEIQKAIVFLLFFVSFLLKLEFCQISKGVESDMKNEKLQKLSNFRDATSPILFFKNLDKLEF